MSASESRIAAGIARTMVGPTDEKVRYLLVASTSTESRLFAASLCSEDSLPQPGKVHQWLESAGSGELLSESADAFFGKQDKLQVLPVEAATLRVLSEINSAKLSGIGVLHCFGRPESAVLAALVAGNSPSEALHEWLESNQQGLRVFKRNRVATLVVNIDAAFDDPAELNRHLQQHFGVELTATTIPHREEQIASVIQKLIAAQMVVQDEAVRDLAVELEASAVMPAIISPLTIDFESVVERLDELSAASQAQITDAKEENELLLLQLHQVQEELEDHYLRLQEQIKANSKLKLESEEASRKLSTRDEGLATARKTIRKQKRKLKSVSEQERISNRKLAAVYASTSWRITGPLRYARRLFKRKPPEGKA